MTPAWSNHLSEEALDDVLIGLGSAESEAHLALCPECRTQVETFRGDVALFNAASTAWSERRHPQPRHRERSGAGMRIAFASWAAAAAALMIMAFGIWHHRPGPPQNQAISVQPQVVDTEAQIAQDNQLLQAVNAAISPDEESPIDEYKILESPKTHREAHSKKRTK
jgi:anti-sigma factor RsiW